MLAILLLCAMTKVNQYKCQYLRSCFSIPIPIPIPEKSSFQYQFQYQYLRKWYFQYQYQFQYRANTSIPQYLVLVLLVSDIMIVKHSPYVIQHPPASLNFFVFSFPHSFHTKLLLQKLFRQNILSHFSSTNIDGISQTLSVRRHIGMMVWKNSMLLTTHSVHSTFRK